MAGDDTTITLDGPAASGKSTVAKRLAERLGYRFLDTGAMYRAATLLALDAGAGAGDSPDGVAAAIAALEAGRLELDADGAVRLAGRKVGDEIRSARVTSAVSRISAIRRVREILTARQREFGARAQPGVVAEGRDMATVVFPRSKHRFFLTASLDVRAARRVADLRRKQTSPPALDQVKAEIHARDEYDSGRDEAPLRIGPGVREVDTDRLDVDGVVDVLMQLIGKSRHA